MLNLFYEEPATDRWVRYDRYPRQLLRRLVRGPARVGGQQRVFLNLCAGLARLGVSYRVNDYRFVQRRPEEIACVVGKPHVLEKLKQQNPVLFGAAVFSHPLQAPDFIERHPNVRIILVPGEWMRQMFHPYYKDKVVAWPVGIDTDGWAPTQAEEKIFDFLLYDKVRWRHQEYERSLLQPIRDFLSARGFRVAELRYGFYEEEAYQRLVKRSKAMIFLCEHETQGIAYQQALSCNVPILAWDRGGFWQDLFLTGTRVAALNSLASKSLTPGSTSFSAACIEVSSSRATTFSKI